MALIAGRTSNPGRAIGSGNASAWSAGFGVVVYSGPGGLRNRHFGGALDAKASTPTGQRNGGAWVLPLKAGELAGTAAGSSSQTLALKGGKAAVGAVGGASTATATGRLIAAGVASTSGSSAAAAALVATRSGSAAASGSSSAAATIGAKASKSASSSSSSTATATLRATGRLAGDITPFTELSPQNLAAAVWDELLAGHVDAGSAGEYLFGAGGGASPSAIAAAVLGAVVEGTITLAESVRLMNAVLGGKVTGAGTATERFRDLGDVKDRVVAAVDAAGNRTAITRDLT